MIQNIVYHILDKEQGVINNGKIYLNPHKLPIDDSTNELFSQLMERYKGRAGKGYGTFEDDIVNFPASSILDNYYINKNFLETTEKLMTVLLSHSNSQVGASGGKVVFVTYTENKESYFLVAILGEKVGLLARDWNLTQDEFLNFENLRFAGRVNLTAWKRDSTERYISFLKGSGDVSDYFKRFLGCNDALMNNLETKKLVELIDSFTHTQKISFQEKVDLRNQAKDYLSNLADNSIQFSLQTFANHIWSTEPQQLIDHFASYGEDNDLLLSDGFVPDKRNLRRLTTYEQKTKNWKLSFGSEAITSGEIDSVDGQIIIKNPNDELISAFSS
ncbi:nucleoid-associated protein [Psychrobacter sp. HD31]|uniref:nucleoid-associated protein n=1 Tax=Psychrobacter sp. HD31 TaxID=3112003 RepID=UPI003DA47514